MSVRHLAWGSVLAVIFLGLIPGVVSAQSGIAGVVRDTSGAVLPGVTVEATSPALIEKVRTVVTDSDGSYRILDVRPGVYAVTFSLPGFSSIKRDGIELPAAFTATVNVDMQVGALEETITVSGAAPLVDIQNATTQQLLSSQVLESIPSARSLQGFTSLMPGIRGTGGLGEINGSVGDMGNSIHGAPPGETIYSIDGVNQATMHAAGGGAGTMFRSSPAYTAEINITTGGGNAEQPFGGGIANIIPKEGGNTFAGSIYGEYSGEGLAQNNLNDSLLAQGFTKNGLSNLVRKWEVSPGFGGRIVRDKLWFFSSYRNAGTIQTRAGVFDNLTPQGWSYTPDLNRPAEAQITMVNTNTRLTYQATPKNKIGVFVDLAPFIVHHRQYNFPLAPEATTYAPYYPNAFKTLTWKSPITNRLLLDVNGSHMVVDLNMRRHTPETCRCSAPAVDFDDISVVEATTGQMWRATSDSVSAGGQQYSHFNPSTWRWAASLSYVTGSHAVKGGLQLHHGYEWFSEEPNGGLAYTLRNGIPTTIFQYANPIEFNTRLSQELGLFIHDQWTIRRLTLTGGLRYDALKSGADAMTLPAGLFVPQRELPETRNYPNWKDVSPRFAASYDLFGDGKTAVKGTINKYVGPAGANGGSLFAMNPGVRAVRRVSRSWGDANGNFAPDCNLNNFGANGECGAISDLNFGQNNPNATNYADELLVGYRDTSWEMTAIIQRQITNGMSVTFGYYHRNYDKFIVNDNVLVQPSDFSSYCVTAPVDSRLPGGGGNQICGLYDVSPALFGRTLTVVRAEHHFGKQDSVYDGFDITETLRLPGGGQISGGVNWGRTVTSACFVVDSPGALRFCEVKPPFQPNLQFITFVPLPWWGLITSATYRDYPPTQITANHTFTNAQIAPSLGRNLSNGVNGTVSVNLVEPGTMFAPRPRQLDFRISKQARFGNRRIMGSIDFFNLFNSAGITTLNNNFGAQWQRPSVLQQGRYFKLSTQFDF
jgi:hypothetical protein